ncbi:hypothetical protein BX600DRAFT_448486 [Xylariales sp. PMI_506]|nr:hypothetical protein BX600DRAFT_448486 [Xylariales sp. PMI_506]
MGYRILHREWRSTNAMWIVMAAELLATIAVLVNFGISQPDAYRTALWQAGNELGFNSSPNIILYAYANYKPLPTIPFVWSQTLTNFNVAISILSLFVLVAKMIAFIMHVWFPVCAIVLNVALTAMYATSVYGQMGPDYADPSQPSAMAWYIAKPCTVAANQTVQSECRMAKGAFAATVIMLSICLANLGLNIWAMIPNATDKLDGDVDSDAESVSSHANRGDKQWEMHGVPQTPRTATMPYTPRTMAFKTLDRKLPLRSQYS